jgi:histidine triad (HIT) family protein
MTEKCLFCRLIAGEVPSDTVYQDKDFLAFRDINPQAPSHVIIVPRSHVTSVAELTEKQRQLAGGLIFLAKKLAEQEGLSKAGYRLVINCGSEGGQTVPHLHLHLLGGRKLSGQLG